MTQSPTPYTVLTMFGYSWANLKDAQGCNIATFGPGADAIETAQFVAHACNCHADLLGALEAALDSMTKQKPLGTREIVLKQIRVAIENAEKEKRTCQKL